MAEPGSFPRDLPRLLLSLERATRERPLERKLLVCRRPAEGRELLHALAAAGVAWVGWEATTVRRLAHETVALALAAEGVALADEFDVLAAADEAMDAVVERGEAGALAEGPGTREAVRGAVEALRRAGIGSATVRSARPGDPRLTPLAAILEAYGEALRRARREDGAGVLLRALSALEEGRAALPAAPLYLLPELTFRGPAGRFTRLLLERGGAEVLETDPVLGLDAPEACLWATGAAASPLSALHLPEPGENGAPQMHLFSAATPADELREVLRRVVTQGIPWDRVEIVAADADVYGTALDALSRRLGIPVTYAEGLDVRRTRVGRALAAYFRWIGEGFPAEVIRGLLEGGDLLPLPGAGEAAGPALARRLRRLRVGWGQDRYLPALDAALSALADAPVPDAEDGTDGAAEAERARVELEALRALLGPLLAAIPRAPDRTGAGWVRTSPAELAGGALVFLACVPDGDASENVARVVLRARLERAQATLTRATTWEAAVGTLRTRLETHIAPGGEGGTAPWTSSGGRLHLSGLSTGGLACRPVTFVVGLDAAAGAGSTGGDPLLTDPDRHLLNRAAGDPQRPLPTSAERAAEARHLLAATLARLRGEVTLSYSAWDSADGRASSPAPELLQVLRHREGSPALGYAELRRSLGAPACAVPRSGAPLDAADVWLAALAGDGRLRDGRQTVRAVYTGLDDGLTAAELRAGAALTVHHGAVSPRAGASEPGAFSASRLEALGTCPRRYFYRYVLGVALVDDPEWDPESWLTPAERGSLLHRVYERTLREARAEGGEPPSPRFALRALEVLEDEAARAALRLPPPGEAVRAAELAELRRDVLAFVEMLGGRPPWIHLEYRFGPGGRELTAGSRGVALRGVIDRVDEAGTGRVRVIDYKTGRPDRHNPGDPHAGGRRVQHLVYALAARRLLEAEVEAVEFHFPTRAGRNETVRFPVPDPEAAEELLDRMAALAEEGPYLSTEDAGDCAYCDFAAVCRAESDAYGGVRSPVAAWMKETGMALPEAEPLRALRGLDG